MSRCLCGFSLEAIIKMKDSQTVFWTAGGRKKLLISEVDKDKQTLRMERSTGKITWRLDYKKLEDLHSRIHSNDLALKTKAIDKIIPTWGNYITGLFKHFGCDKGC